MMVRLEALERASKGTIPVQQHSEVVKLVREYSEVAKQPRRALVQTQVVRQALSCFMCEEPHMKSVQIFLGTRNHPVRQMVQGSRGHPAMHY